MDVPAPEQQGYPVGPYTVERYRRLIDDGVLGPDDRVELLEGVVVAMAPQNNAHAAGVGRVSEVLFRAVGERAAVRVQLPFVVGPSSMPEPDTAVVPGRSADYDRAHPRTALLVVEVADSSLQQDRLTKAVIYATAAVPEYWIVDVRGQQVEVYRTPDPSARRYRERQLVRRGQVIQLVAFPDTTVRTDDLLPVLED